MSDTDNRGTVNTCQKRDKELENSHASKRQATGKPSSSYPGRQQYTWPHMIDDVLPDAAQDGSPAGLQHPGWVKRAAAPLQIYPSSPTLLTEVDVLSDTDRLTTNTGHKQDKELDHSHALKGQAADKPSSALLTEGEVLKLRETHRNETGYVGVSYEPSSNGTLPYRARLHKSAGGNVGQYRTAFEAAVARAKAEQAGVKAEEETDTTLLTEVNGVKLHLSSTSSTGYTGVTHTSDTSASPFAAAYRKKRLGVFASATEAALEYARAAGDAVAAKAAAHKAMAEARGLIMEADGMQLLLSEKSLCGYLGVREPTPGHFSATVYQGGKGKHIGTFSTALEAARALFKVRAAGRADRPATGEDEDEDLEVEVEVESKGTGAGVEDEEEDEEEGVDEDEDEDGDADGDADEEDDEVQTNYTSLERQRARRDGCRHELVVRMRSRLSHEMRQAGWDIAPLGGESAAASGHFCYAYEALGAVAYIATLFAV
jgi:hypothetical protein